MKTYKTAEEENAENKLFILDLLNLNKSIKIDNERFYPEDSVINIIKQVLKIHK